MAESRRSPFGKNRADQLGRFCFWNIPSSTLRVGDLVEDKLLLLSLLTLESSRGSGDIIMLGNFFVDGRLDSGERASVSVLVLVASLWNNDL